jgi:predicted SAM-dependent methyltransferase
MKLDLGCADKKREGYIGMDLRDWGQEIVRDIARGIPFNDETFDEVYTSHFMEHIERGTEIYWVMSEVYRVLKSGGAFVIRVPHSDGRHAFYPDHLSYWNEEMVEALINDSYQGYGDYKFKIEANYSRDLGPVKELVVLLRKE